MLKRFSIICALAALLVPVMAQAQNAAIAGYGPRAGFTSNPDQFTFGGQLAIQGVSPNFSIDPSVELGFGDHATVVALNLDGKHPFALRNSNWSPYLGAGFGLNYVRVKLDPGFGLPTFERSETSLGANVIGGASLPMNQNRTFFSEVRLGIGDIPDFKIMAGMNFGK